MTAAAALEKIRRTPLTDAEVRLLLYRLRAELDDRHKSPPHFRRFLKGKRAMTTDRLEHTNLETREGASPRAEFFRTRDEVPTGQFAERDARDRFRLAELAAADV